MIGALAREMPEGTSWNEPDGGYFLGVDLPGGMTGEALLAQAGEVDVTFVKGADCYWDGGGDFGDQARVLLCDARGDRRGHRQARAPRARGGRGHGVSGPGYRTAHLDELERFDGDTVTIPVRIPLGIGSFGINAYAAREVGDHVIEDHDELGAGAGHHEELYFVLKGHARFMVDGDELDGPPGSFVFVRTRHPPRGDGGRGRHDRARHRRDTRRAVRCLTLGIMARGAAALHGEGLRGATAIMARALEGHPDNPNVLYNLACCEALAGRARMRSHTSCGSRSATRTSRDGRARTPTSTRSGRGRFPAEAQLGRGVGPERGPRDQPGLLRRLETRRLRRAKGRAGAVVQRAQTGLAEIAVAAGIFPPLGHRPGTTI